MDIFKYLFCVICLLTSSILCDLITTTTEKYEILIAESAEITDFPQDVFTEIQTTTEQHKNTHNKTITELVKEQTDAIKKIISEQKQTDLDYPVVTRKDVDITERPKTKEEQERESIEELKRKCALFKETNLERISTTEKPKMTVLPFGPPIKPDFLRIRTKFPQFPKPTQQTQQSNYFIFTQNPNELYGIRNNKFNPDKIESAASEVITEDKVIPPNNYIPPVDIDNIDKPKLQVTGININTIETTAAPIIETTTQINEFKYKYVRLEPVVLQKTLLTNGKSLFYWYRTLPSTQSFVKIPDTPENADVDKIAQPQNPVYQNAPIPEQYHLYVDPQTGTIVRNEKPITTTTTTLAPPTQTQFTYQAMPQFFLNPQTGLIYQNAHPSQLIYHNRKTPNEFKTPIVTTTTTTEIPIHEKVPQINVEYPPATTPNPMDRYRNEFRFVIPMNVNSDEIASRVSKYPYDLDPYAYMPQHNRPNLMNIPVPYLPNYHMIRTLSVPRPEVDKNLDEVSMSNEQN